MKRCFPPILVCLCVAFVTFAAARVSQSRLTPSRIYELTASGAAPASDSYKIAISAIGEATLPRQKLEGEIKQGKPLIFPTEFDPPQAAQNGAPVLTPTTPTAFITVDTGWTVRLNAKPHGKLLAVSGVAEYTTAKMLPAGYGAIAGPVYAENGDTVTPNKAEQPRLEKTSTHSHVFALPGEVYEVSFYKGEKTEKHTITVSAQ